MKLRQIMGEKLNMSQMPDRHGRVSATTILRVSPNVVVKLNAKKALVAFGYRKKLANAIKGIVKGLKDVSPRVLKELELGNEEVKKGEQVKVGDVFRKGDLVDITGISKGKGFAGGVKRHGFAGGPKTHGQSDRHRAPGSIGSGTTPGRVLKGLRMAGHMGVDQVTIQGLEILDIDEENNLVTIRGAVPGSRTGVVTLTRSIKKKKAYHEPEIPALPQLPKEEPSVSDENVESPASQPVAESKEVVPVEAAKENGEDTNG